MWSRVTLVEIDPLRMDVDAAIEHFKQEVVPGLQELDGYAGAAAFVTPEGRGMVISFWETEEAAAATVDFAAGQVERLMTVFASPPGREHYEVVYLDLPGVTVH
jgi:hypothetical protein